MSSSTVSYNEGEMQSVCRSYTVASNRFSNANRNMRIAINDIRGAWHGDDADAAEEDLKAIETQLDSIDNNLQEINKLLAQIVENFGSLKY